MTTLISSSTIRTLSSGVRHTNRGHIDRAYGVVVDSDDNVVVTGYSEFMETALL